MISEKNIAENKESFRDRISTVDEKGKRRWIYPKKVSGRFFFYRQILGYFLLTLLFVMPFIKIHGTPFLLLDVINRKFYIFSIVFYPQDFYIFGLLMILGVLFIALFTVVLGRLFCGWACPQTIFMELVFRKIEYWIEGDWKEQMQLDKMPWNSQKLFKKTVKHFLFLLVSFVISNLFLSYLIGVEQLKILIKEGPVEHLAGFSSLIIFSLVFYGVFAFLREQVCTNICPYGRLQGVLIGPDTLVIAYDYIRGEPRAKFKKNEDRKLSGKGDCIDCMQCVHVCPTGIDIRNGTQLECVNCALCIDACDFMMEKVGLPKGLIKYSSEYQIKENQPYKLNIRAKAYLSILLLLAVVSGYLLVTRSEIDGTILRSTGSMALNENGWVKNIYTYKLINKSNKDFYPEVKIIEPKEGRVEFIGKIPLLKKEDFIQGSILVAIPRDKIKNVKSKVILGVYDQDGRLIKKFKTNFLNIGRP